YDGNENVVFPEMGIVAKVTELDPEYEQFFVEWFMYDPPIYENAAEARSHIIPYALEIYNPKSAYISLGVGLLIIVLFVVAGILIYNKYKASSTPSYCPSAAPASNDFTIEKKPSEDGFEETYTPPQPVPIPDIPQPPDADEFFARAPKPSAPAAEAAPKEEPAALIAEEPKQETVVPAVAESVAGSMDVLDTTGLLDDADYEVDISSDESEFIE
ncbi:MAG: hypothetical protein IJ305_03540, partial [Oscillospiraceae bacterium]|nr:hypothetical protein [Oscillospiraceae bacterium]